jgi:16S rRNA (guanine(966)-N(2))-methyltransferase RsmD
MRVIAGKFRSRTLKTLPGLETRPTYDRLKETLFNVLQSANRIDQSRFLDLFAGSGSIGIEALSRGALSVHFVENNRKAARVIRENLDAMGIKDEAVVTESAVAEALRSLDEEGAQFDLIFLDPPYAMQGAYLQTFRLLDASSLLAPEAIVVAEHDKRYDPGGGEGDLRRYRKLTQGESSLSFYRRENDSPIEVAELEALFEDELALSSR